ncbi:metallophosphoesterase family protein [Propionivibrio sp.]|uniref:metallophosphoesterase family protein n=1 Tax=Propionivibrio sp. TaxID=2212460 RepID=UPI003BF1F66D
MKFIHAADIHLDSPLSGLSAYQDAPTDLLRTATRDAFSNLVGEAIDEAVDFVIIAGDLYDGNWKDYNTGVFFSREMGRLHAASIPVFLIYGNHDAESEMTRKLSLPANVTAFASNRAHTLRLDHLKVALHGQSFKHAATTDNLAADYPPRVDGWLNIGVLHTALEGYAAHASYAPCSLAELLAKGYDYWALGHVHEHAVLHTEPWIVFPGNLQGRHIRETGARGAILVTADEDRIVSVERICTDVLRWHRLEVDVSAADDLATAVRCVSRKFSTLLETAQDGRPMAVRVVLNGRSTAHGDLFGNEAQLRAEILSLAASLAGDRAWIEKVRVETTPVFDAAAVRARADAIADLQSLLDLAPADPALLAALTEELRYLADITPHELSDALPQLKAIRNGEVGAIIESVVPGLIAYLIKAG